jgi:hypothetical protein
MSVVATVQNGVVILPPELKLPDGAKVEITVPDQPKTAFADRYAAYVGVADDLPADLSQNIDHYVHGHRKP